MTRTNELSLPQPVIDRFWRDAEQRGRCLIWRGGPKFFLNNQDVPIRRMAVEVMTGRAYRATNAPERCSNPQCIYHLRDVIEQTTKRLRGQRFFPDEVDEIRRLYWIESRTQTFLAALYDIEPCVVGAIVNGRTYRNVPFTSEVENSRRRQLRRAS